MDNYISKILNDYRFFKINSTPAEDLPGVVSSVRDMCTKSNIKIFVMNGKSGSGKTLFETMVKNLAFYDGHTVVLLSMAADVKDFCMECLGWDGSRDEKSRKLLADIISALGEYSEVPKFCVLWHMKEELKERLPVAFFIDARETKDIKWFEDNLGAISVEVSRPTDTNNWNNAADQDRYYDYDIHVENIGTIDDLREDARAFYNIFILENESKEE